MGKQTGISWTDHTFNPWWGCAHASPGCDNCYAETFDNRLGLEHWGPKAPRRHFGPKHWAAPVAWNLQAQRAGVRARVFCASMADVFEDRFDLEVARAKLFQLLEATPFLDWQLLTKRPGNVPRMVPAAWLAGGWPRNAWIGTTVEDQRRADERIPLLLQAPAPVRFLSCEPLLERVDLSQWIKRIDHCGRCCEEHPPQGPDHCPACGEGGTLIATWGERQAEDYREGRRYDNGALGPDGDGPEIHWVIVGGESGCKARPFSIGWARSLRDQCAAAGVPYFFKQAGAYVLDDRRNVGEWERLHTPTSLLVDGQLRVFTADRAGADPAEWPEDLRGRQFPEVPPCAP